MEEAIPGGTEQEPKPSQAPAAGASAAEVSAKLAELDAAIEKFKAQKRWSDVVRKVLAKVDLVEDSAEKVMLLKEAATLYLERSSNQAEAIKCYERVLEHEPHDVEAVLQLKDLYERRRDWEKLLRTMQKEAEMMDPQDRLLRYVEMAQLATERLRKPAVCIEIWEQVRALDPAHPDALSNLAMWYERSREWRPLTEILESLARQGSDIEELKQLLQKLGMIYADKLEDSEGAVSAYNRLLSLDPEDRRAQEQLKRRYVALKAWDQLEEFYSSTGKWDELIRIFERESEASETSTEDRVVLLLRVARLWETRLDKPERAARAYEKIREIDPQNLQAAEALSPIYQASQNSKGLAEVYEVRLRYLEEPEARLELLRDTGLLYENALGKSERAFECLLEAFGLDPNRDDTRQDLERLASQVDGWEQVTRAYEGAIARSSSEDDQVGLRLRLGWVLTQVGRTEDAIREFKAVYEARRGHPEVLAALGDLYRATGRFNELLEIYNERLEYEVDSDLRRTVAYARASLWESELQESQKAVDAYQEILAEYGDEEVQAFEALDRLYESLGQWQELADTLERCIELGSDAEERIAALKYRLGQVLERHLNDKARAVELYREVLVVNPDHMDCRAALESLLDDAQVGAKSAQILEPIYELLGEWQKLVRVMRVLQTHAEDREERLAWLTKIGQVLVGRLGAAEEAFRVYCAALKEAPESRETLGQLEVLAGEQDRFGELVQLISDLASQSRDAALARYLWTRAAQLADGQLGDVDRAVDAYQRVLELDYGDPREILEALESLYVRTERWRDLAGVLRKAAELSSDDAQRIERLSQIAELYSERIGEAREAIAVYKEVLEIDPANSRALSALDELFEAQEMWADLADNVDRQLAMADDPIRQIHLMLRLADLREKRMASTEAAIETYREVVEREPDNPVALSALERLLAQGAHRGVITEILEPIYRDIGDYEKLIAVYRIQVDLAASPSLRVELLHRIAEIYEAALDRPDLAFQSFSEALREDPANLITQEHLERVARMMGGGEALAEVYEERVREIRDAQLAAQLLMRAAEIREGQLGDVESAISHYRRVLELDPQHFDAASALERLFQLTERYEDLAQVYLAKATMVPSPEEQKDYLFRAASIYEDVLERPADAVGVFTDILEVDPDEIRAVDKLIELYLRLEQFGRLLEVYKHKADLVVDPEEKKRLFLEVGAVYEREVGDIDKAINTYQHILEFDPDDLIAIGRLDALYQASGNWTELLGVLEREVELSGDPTEIASYKFRIAQLWHHKLDDASRAVEMYREILEVFPEHDPTIRALEEMVAAGKEPVPAALVLENIYREAGEWAKLIGVLEVQVENESDPLRRVELLHQIAELYEFQLDAPTQAFHAHARALPSDAQDELTLGSLERLADQLNGWPEVAKLYDAELEKLERYSPDAASEMALRAAVIYEVHLGDPQQAIERYRFVVEADSSHPQALEALDRLYEATGRWEDLAEILRREIANAANPEDALELQFKLGQTLQHHRGDVEGAIAQYREILAAAPEHAKALQALEALFAQGFHPTLIGEILEPLYRMQEAWDRLLQVLEVRLSHMEDREERVTMMHRMVEIAEERADDEALAFLWMQRALMEDPTHDHSLAEVERLARMLDGWSQLADTYAEVLETAQNEDARIFVGRRLAQVYEVELGDLQRAEETYRYVLGIRNDEESLEALDRIYDSYGAHEALAEILNRRIQLGQGSFDQVELNYRLAQLLENDLRRVDEAMAIYQRILKDVDAQHIDSLRALQNIFVQQEDWRSLFDVFAKELEVTFEDSAQADIVAAMAYLAAEKLGDAARAIELWRQVLELRGEDAEALNALGNIYASQQNWQDLVEILDREANVEESEAVRVQIYSDLGRIWFEKLGRDRNALESWERVLDIDPSNTEALFFIADVYRGSQQWVELVDTLHRLINVGGSRLDAETLENIYSHIGYLYSQELQQPMDAIDAYRKVLDVNPHNTDALNALERIHRQEGQWEDAIQIMEMRLEVLESPQDRIAALLSIARMWDQQVGDRHKGASAFDRVLEIDPMHEYSFAQVEELYQEGKRWDSLIEMYLGRVEASKDKRERVKLLRKVAKVYEEELHDRERAFEALQVAWAEDYTHADTALDLERLAGLTQKWNELLAVANQALQETQEARIKIAICLQCARWYGQQLGHPEYAVPYYQQILAIDPVNVEAMRQIAELHRTTHNWQALAQTLARLVEMTEDAQERADTYVQLGNLSQDQLNAAQQAPSYYLQALEVDSQCVPALSALEVIYESREEWPELVDMLRRKAEALTDPEEILDTKLKLAETYEHRSGDLEAAIAVYREVVEADPQNLRALRSLESLYEQSERWHELLEVLEAEYDVVTTEKDRISILLRLASMWEQEFVKPDRAAERLESVLEIDPNHEEALGHLARLYQGMQRWHDLISTYERHVSATPNRAEKVRLYKLIGEVNAHEIGDIDRAIDAHLNVLHIDEEDVESMDALTRLYEKRGDHSSALETMEQLVVRLREPSEQTELRFRMGRLLSEQLGDRVAALEQFQNVIDIDPAHIAALQAMREIQADAGDWLAVARLLEKETEVQENPRLVSAALVELGDVYERRLDNHERAVEAYEAAYAKDKDNELAAMPLAEEYVRQERHADALPLLQMLVLRSGKRERDEQQYLSHRLGEVALKLEHFEEAVRSFSKAYELDSTHLPSLMGLAAAYFGAKQWDKAFKYYQMLLVHHRDALGRDEIADIFYHLGVVKREQGERRKALNMFDKALEEDGYHRPTLEAIVKLYESQHEWEQVIHFKKRVLEVVTDDERFHLLSEVGDLWKEKVGNVHKAIESYVDASALQPDDHKVLHKLLVSYQETRRWEDAIDIIGRISDLDGRDEAKSKYAYTIGVILRDELKSPEAALDKFNEALDLDFNQLKAFEAINKIITQQKDWKQLERAFRKMLHRILGKEQTELEFSLWHNLGLIYRDRLGNFDSAIEAFQMASRLQPHQETEHQILAELFAVIPGRGGEAVQEHQWLLRHNPERVDSYQALYKLYSEAREYDKAWCVAAALSFLNRADNEQQQFYQQYKQQGMIRPQARLDNERWIKDLLHPDEDPYLGKIFEIAVIAVQSLRASTDKALNLNKKFEVDPASSTVTFARTFGFVSQVLNLKLVPRLFLRPDVPGGLVSVPASDPPASICGASLLSGFSPQDLAFVIGRHLAYYRGEHFVRTLLSTAAELKAIFLAAMRLGGVGPDDPQIEVTSAKLASRLAPTQLEALRSLCKKLVNAEAKTDIRRWMQAVELTACRAGFVMCNDLETAARMVQEIPPEGAVDVSPKAKLTEIVVFSVSENYFRLRESLGIQIKV